MPFSGLFSGNWERISGLRKIFHKTRENVEKITKNIVDELKAYNSPMKIEKIDFYFTLLGQQLAEMKKWEERIPADVPLDEVYSDDGITPQNLYSQTIDRIMKAAIRTDEHGVVFVRLQSLVSQLQMPGLEQTLMNSSRTNSSNSGPSREVQQSCSSTRR